MRVLAKDARRKRTEGLPELDADVHLLLHARRARVADDAAAAQRARTELHAALEPSDDLLVRHQARHPFQQSVLVGHVFVGGAHGVEEQADVVVRKRGTEQGATLSVGKLGLPGVVQLAVPDQQRCAERAAGIAGGRLNPDVLERPFTQQAPVRHAVERHAAGHDQVGCVGQAVEMPRRAEHRVFAHHLNGRGEVHFLRGDERLGLTRRTAEQLMEPGRRHRQPLAIVEVRHVHPDRSVGHHPDEPLPDQIDVSRLRHKAPGPSACTRLNSRGSPRSR